jgi:Berberine and berberine like
VKRHLAWVQQVTEGMEPFTTGGVCLNFIADVGEAPVRAGYGAKKYERLAALKKTCDPDNVSRCNQNITPAA